MAEQIKTASAIWSGKDYSFEGVLGCGYRFSMGSPSNETCGSPMEFLLAGVAGCTGVDVSLILEKQRQAVEGIEVHIVGERAESHPQVYTSLKLHYVIRGEGLSEAAVKRAIRLSEEKYCSASIMFRRAGVPFESTFEILEDSARVAESV